MGNQQINGASGHGGPSAPGVEDPRHSTTSHHPHHHHHHPHHQHPQTSHSYSSTPTTFPTPHQHQQQQQQQQQHLSLHGGYSPPVTASGYAGYPSSNVTKGNGQAAMQRSLSDASMTMLDDNSNSNLHQMGTGQQQQLNLENWLDDDTVPTVFRWEHGGRQVYITGTFNGWSRQIPMHRSGNDFTYIHNLKRGKHAFKFIVDDEWRFAPDQPTVADIEGRINNFIDVSDFKPYTGDKEFEKEKAAAEYGCYGSGGDEPAAAGDEVAANAAATTTSSSSVGAGPGPGPAVVDAKLTENGLKDASSSSSPPSSNIGGSRRPDKDGEIYGHVMPDLDDYTKEPPPLPPHLRHIILNKPPQLQDTAALPVPQHVALNHLYCTAIKDNMMVLGITQRFKTKFVTTVYYSPCSSK